jgi:DNA-binding HxlR family transcriptional regulator
MPSTPTRTADRCSIARSLDVLGQKWTLLVIREAFWGRTRFAEFRSRLGIAPDVLSDRLSTLVENGIMSRRSYRDEGEREREEYVLTAAGRDLLPVLTALLTWGDTYRPTGFGPAALPVEAGTGRPLRLAFLDEAGAEVPQPAVSIARGPGAADDPAPVGGPPPLTAVAGS